MRSITDGFAGTDTPSPDLTTRARIRDAAIVVFGDEGFRTGVRAVAATAGVSPGLVNHHFGSKDGLREACDDHVLTIIRTRKERALTTPGPAAALADLADIEQYAPLVAYIVRSFQAGGRLAGSLFEHMVTDTERYLDLGVREGRVRPSRDPARRARHLTLNSLGSLLLFLQLRADRDGAVDWAGAIRDLATEATLPALELYTEGLLTEPTLLDAYLDTDAHPATDAHPDSGPRPGVQEEP